MEDLIEALTILQKYHNGSDFPTSCDDGEFRVVGIKTGSVSLDDKSRLDELGFFRDEDEDGCYLSFRYGSC